MSDRMSNKTRKSILWFNENGHSIEEIARRSGIAGLYTHDEVQAVIDDYYKAEEAREQQLLYERDKKQELADRLFPHGEDEWDRTSMLDDLVEYLREEGL